MSEKITGACSAFVSVLVWLEVSRFLRHVRHIIRLWTKWLVSVRRRLPIRRATPSGDGPIIESEAVLEYRTLQWKARRIVRHCTQACFSEETQILQLSFAICIALRHYPSQKCDVIQYSELSSSAAPVATPVMSPTERLENANGCRYK